MGLLEDRQEKAPAEFIEKVVDAAERSREDLKRRFAKAVILFKTEHVELIFFLCFGA